MLERRHECFAKVELCLKRSEFEANLSPAPSLAADIAFSFAHVT